ncbi:MAG: hypothetical protein KGD59_08210 [Candidatus Heimdallarchaeota archaeon]|nr:hypothetical protein [Candidatus Heimdallarchaeota archaeon]MBY8994520.1 hypothetical protein [Candidatus Heimdallarchaeota archaeon]
MFRFKVITKKHPTESFRKIATALNAIVEGEVLEEKVGEETYLYIEKNNYSALEKLYELVRKQRILDVSRKTLRNNIVGQSTIFYVNKQVAFIGKINFCDEIGESPLGPIRVELEHEKIEQLVDWLTPYTKNGVEVTLVKKFP